MDEPIQTIPPKSNHLNVPIIFCINNYRFPVQEHPPLAPRLSLDAEFDLSSEDQEEDINNSFIYMLCERLSDQFSFQHIHYDEYEQLKNNIIETLSTSNGYIIDQFPTSLDDLQRFQKEVMISTLMFFFPLSTNPCRCRLVLVQY